MTQQYSRAEVEAARLRARTIDARIEALEAALRAVLEDMLGPCEPGCDCVLHRALLPEARAMKFRKKPVVIEAMQFDGQNTHDIMTWANKRVRPYDLLNVVSQYDGLYVNTLEGPLTCSPGDWIIKGVAGEFYPCKPDIFAATYEPVEPAMIEPGIPTE